MLLKAIVTEERVKVNEVHSVDWVTPEDETLPQELHEFFTDTEKEVVSYLGDLDNSTVSFAQAVKEEIPEGTDGRPGRRPKRKDSPAKTA